VTLVDQATRWIRGSSTEQKPLLMTMPTMVIDPVTGLRCWTKHPEKLIARRQAKMELHRLVITAQRLESQQRDNPTYWNGSDNPAKMHRPGEVRS